MTTLPLLRALSFALWTALSPVGADAPPPLPVPISEPLTRALAAVLGAPEPLALATAEEASRRGDAHLLARVLVWEKYESRWGTGLSGRRWDSRAYGVLQVRGRPDLERDARGNVRAWLDLLDVFEHDCGSRSAGLRAVASGHCDWAGPLVESRESEAELALSLAALAIVPRQWR